VAVQDIGGTYRFDLDQVSPMLLRRAGVKLRYG
jgi:hypothetical protein